MAAFTRATGAAGNPIHWDKQLFHDHLLKTSLSSMMGGRGSGKPIIVDTTLKAEAGDTKRYEFIPWNEVEPLRGQNVAILGNESSLSTFTQDVTVDLRRFAFRTNGLMTEQRTNFQPKEQCRDQVRKNFTQYNENVIFKAWAGIADTETVATYQSDTDTSDRVSGVARCLRASGSNDSALVTAASSDNTALNASMTAATDFISVNMLEEANFQARTGGAYRLNPFSLDENGVEQYFLFVHPRCANHLKNDPDWIAHALRGKDLDLPNTFKSSVVGQWDNIIVMQNERVPLFLESAGVFFARNILVGADSLLLAWAMTTKMTEEPVDHGSHLSVAGSEIRGQTKVTFNSVDMGVMQLVSSAEKQ